MVEEKKSRWWNPIRIFLALMAVVALLFVFRGYYVEILRDSLRDRPQTVLGAATVVAAVVVLLLVGQHYKWTGIGQTKVIEGVQPSKTLWNWLELLGTLAIPLAVAIATGWFSSQQAETQRNVEEKRAAAEQRLQDEREQDVAYQTYVDQMGTLMIEKDLRDTKQDSEVRTLARARTLTLLGRLDSSRKGRLLRFLYEAKLINKRNPILDLTGVDASDADLSRTVLGGVNLIGVDLSGADLSGAVLVEADLSCSPPAYWWMKSKQNCTDLSGANLSGANLHQTNLSCAPAPEWYMEPKRTNCVDLRKANLSGADLYFADLSGANLTGADVTQERLDEQANSLLGARMPNGQQYEEWVADRKGGGEEMTKRVAHEGCEGDSAVVNAPPDFRKKALNDCVKSILD